MNSTMLMLLLMPQLFSGLTGQTGGTALSTSSLLPLMMLSGGMKGNNQSMMLTMMTGNPLFMLMGNNQRRYRRRRFDRNAYNKGFAAGTRAIGGGGRW